MSERRDICREFEEALPELVRQAQGASVDAPLLRHAESCRACGDGLRRERRLQAWLTDQPEAPARLLALPDVAAADRRLAVRRRFLWAAAAAAALVVGLRVAAPWGGRGDARAVGASFHVFDDASPLPAWDERLVGLAAGAEQMASFRSAAGR